MTFNCHSKVATCSDGREEEEEEEEEDKEGRGRRDEEDQAGRTT